MFLLKAHTKYAIMQSKSICFNCGRLCGMEYILRAIRLNYFTMNCYVRAIAQAAAAAATVVANNHNKTISNNSFTSC